MAQLTVNKNTIITAEAVQNLHERLLQKGDTNWSHHNILQFVSIIGGIDKIMSDYLSTSISDEMVLTQSQLKDIMVLITNYDNKDIEEMESLSHNGFNLSLRSEYNHMSNKPIISEELVFHFNKDHTYLHCIFGKELGSKIVDGFIYNKIYLYPMFVLVNVGFLQFFIGYIDDIFILIPAFVMWTIVIPWLFLVILSVNIKAFKMIAISFDFWIKVLYMIIFGAAKFYYIHYKSIYIEESRKQIVWFIYDMIYTLIRVFIILIWSCLDALQFPLYIKIYLGLLISIVYSLNAVFISLYSESNGDDSIIHINDSMAISLISYIDSSIRIVALFLWKQTILSILYQRRCILIKYSPFIEWVDVTNIKNNTETLIDNKLTATIDDTQMTQWIDHDYKVNVDERNIDENKEKNTRNVLEMTDFQNDESVESEVP